MSDLDRVEAVAHEVLAAGKALSPGVLIATAFGAGLRPPGDALAELARHLARVPGLRRLPDGRLCSVAAVLAERRLTVDPADGVLPLWPDLPHLRLRFPDAARVGVRHPGGALLAPLTDRALVVGRAALRGLEEGPVIVRCRRAGVALEASAPLDGGDRWPAALRAAALQAARKGSPPALIDVLLTALADDLHLGRDRPVPPLGRCMDRSGLVLEEAGTVTPRRTSAAADRTRTRTARPRPPTVAARRASAPHGTPHAAPRG